MTTREIAVRNTMDVETMATHFLRSGFFKDANDQSKAIVKILYGAELGIGPVASMTGIHVIEGKPTLSAGLLASQIKRSGKYTYRVVEITDQAVALEFLERVDGQWESAGVSRFTMEDARAAGVAGKDVWRKYPRNMLFARALSNGQAWYCPDVTDGPVYVPEELGAPVDGEGNVIDVTPDSAATPVEGEVVTPPKPARPATAQRIDAMPSPTIDEIGKQKPGDRIVPADDVLWTDPAGGILARADKAVNLGVDMRALLLEMGIKAWAGKLTLTQCDAVRDRLKREIDAREPKPAPEPEREPEPATA